MYPGPRAGKSGVKCPGGKIRSKGRRRGLGTGRGKSFIGVPYRAKGG